MKVMVGRIDSMLRRGPERQGLSDYSIYNSSEVKNKKSWISKGLELRDKRIFSTVKYIRFRHISSKLWALYNFVGKSLTLLETQKCPVLPLDFLTLAIYNSI